jgi:hypothetical protein
MLATKLVVNVRVAVPSEERSKIRAAVKAYESVAKSGSAGADKVFNKVSGKLSYLGQYHDSESKALRAHNEFCARPS